MLKRLRKQTCSWQSAWSASGCGNISRLFGRRCDCRFSHYPNSLLKDVVWNFTGAFHRATRNHEEVLKPTCHGDKRLKPSLSLACGVLCLEGSGKKKKTYRHVMCLGLMAVNRLAEEFYAHRYKKKHRSELTKGFTFTMFAVSFIARLADAFIWPNGVLADCVDAAVVKHLCALIHI